MLLAAMIAGGSVAQAQSSFSTPPRFDSPGCGGLLCREPDPNAPNPNDPAQAAAAAAYNQPTCGGILCDIDPRGMRQPVTAAEAREAAARRDEAAMPAAPPAMPTPKRHRRARAHAKAKHTADAGAAKPEVDR